MPRAFRPLVLVLAAVALGASLAPARSSFAKPGETHHAEGELFFARPTGAKGELLAYDTATGELAYRLPPGMLSADRGRYFAASPDGEGTTLDWHSLVRPAAGGGTISFPLDGAWDLAGVSPTGRWVALIGRATEERRRAWTEAGTWQTAIRIFDVEEGKTAQEFTLDGNFEVETVSARGDALFLVQHLPAVNPDHYLVRLYDLTAEALAEGALRAKTPGDEIMAGLAWEGIGSPDGRWLLTLYLSTRRDVAFVHSLDLVNRLPVCIDLPSGDGDLALLKEYTLTLAPDGRRAYAVNPALGRLAEVNLELQTVDNVVPFAPQPPTAETYDPDRPTGRTALSPDGRTLYFTGGEGVWAYDTAAGEVAGPLPVAGPIVGLGVSGDGARLFAAHADGTLLALDPTTGERLTFAGATHG